LLAVSKAKQNTSIISDSNEKEEEEEREDLTEFQFLCL